MAGEKNTRSRKWQLTINNPLEHELPHERIIEILSEFKSLEYYCMADEKGHEEETYHTHIYIYYNEPVRFSTIKNAFSVAHIEQANGTSQQNRDYITKEGKHSDKHDTCIDGTFEEWGEMPVERQGQRTDLINIIQDVIDGKTNCEIIRSNPKAFNFQKHMNDFRQELKYEEVRELYRQLDIEYIYGPTRIGKTRSVYDVHGYCKVYSVDDYEHPFDMYAGEQVMLFDEFRSQLRISDMLKYLDGHPLKLKARYQYRIACYTKVYIVSNEPLRDQYIHIQREQPSTWQAFLARINRLYEFTANGKQERDIAEHMLDIGQNTQSKLPWGGRIITDEDVPQVRFNGYK